jgi:hypothetical protein
LLKAIDVWAHARELERLAAIRRLLDLDLKRNARRLSSHSSQPPQKQAWQGYFPKRTIVGIDRQQLRSLRLRETESDNRLTVDVDSVRLDIGRAATEVEREWLYQVLVNRYSILALQKE